MKPAAVDYLRKKRLDHRGIPMGSTSPYGGISETDINTTGPLEEPLAAPLDDATAHEVDPLAQPAEVFAGHEQRADAEDAGPRHSTIPAQVAQSIAAVAPSTVPSVPQDTRDADEIDAAREADRASRLTAGLELAGRQLVGGITRTPVGQGIGAAPSEMPGAMARVKSRQERAAEAIRLKRQGVMDQATLDENKSQAELRRAQAAHLLMTKKGGKGPDPEELESYKAVMSKRYPDFAEDFNALTSMKGAQDLQNAAEGKLQRESNERVGDKAAYRGDKFRQDAEARADADAKAKKLEADAAAFGKDTAGRAVFSKRLAELESTIPKSGSVPGTGVLGDALAWFDSKAGTDFQSPEAIKVRQNIGLLMSAILREQSGATVSEQEYARAVQNGLSTKNAATTREALKRLRDEFAITERDIRAKYSPEAVSLYEGRQKKALGPATGGEMVKIKRTKDGVTKSVSKATANDLLKKGGYEVAP